MLYLLAPQTCAFDCEWVPCPTTARRLLHLPADSSDAAAMQAVWAYTSQQEAARSGREPVARPFIKLVLSKVVSIAAVLRQVDRHGQPTLRLYARSCADRDEEELIGGFLELVAAEQWQLWGYNSANADLPLLKQRALALGVACPLFSKRPGRYARQFDYHDSRYGNGHIDILELIGGYGGGAKKPSLAELAAACGFPGKLDVTGADVAHIWLASRTDEILAYNELDALTTHLLMLRVGLHTGHLTPTHYARELDAVAALVGQQINSGHEAFRKFWTAWQGVTAAPQLAANTARREQLQSRWPECVAAVRATVGVPAAVGLRAIKDISVAGDSVFLCFDDESSCRLVANRQDAVAPVIGGILGVPAVNLVCQAQAGPTAA